MILLAITTGFGASSIKPVIRTGQLLPSGKHIVQIISAEFVPAKASDEYVREEGEKQLAVGVKNSEGYVTVYLNDRGFVRMNEVTSADIPSDLDFKALKITKTDFQKLSEGKKIQAVFTESSDGHAVRKDNQRRIISEMHTTEAQEITGAFFGNSGLTEEDDFNEDNIASLLKGRIVGINVTTKEYNGDTKVKIKSSFQPKPEQIEAMLA